MSEHATTRVAAWVPDLIDRSKVAAAGDVTFVRDAAGLRGVDADLIVVDLAAPGALDVLPTLHVRTIAFGRHTARDLLAAARAAGCEVLVRSEFFDRLPELLR